MPKIKREQYQRTETYQAAMADSNAAGEKADCAVRAVLIVANALGRPTTYFEAHAAFIREGRRSGRGTFDHQTLSVLKLLGLKVEREWEFGYRRGSHFELYEKNLKDITSKYPKGHQRLKSITTHHFDRFPEVWQDGRVYFVHINGHVAPLVNGVLHDHNRGRAKRVLRIRRVIRESQP